MGVAGSPECDERPGGQQQQRVELPQCVLPPHRIVQEADATDRNRDGQQLFPALDPEPVGVTDLEVGLDGAPVRALLEELPVEGQQDVTGPDTSHRGGGVRSHGLDHLLLRPVSQDQPQGLRPPEMAADPQQAVREEHRGQEPHPPRGAGLPGGSRRRVAGGGAFCRGHDARALGCQVAGERASLGVEGRILEEPTGPFVPGQHGLDFGS